MYRQSDFPDHPNVMVSSSYADLTAHRDAVCEALLRLHFFPIRMEHDSAKSGKDVIESSLEMVAGAKAYIGIIGHLYGGVPTDPKRNPDGLSITELEYREALRRRLPTYIFLMSDDHPVKDQDVEPVEALRAKLNNFKADVRARSICPTFSSVQQLQSLTLQSMSELRELLAGKSSPFRVSTAKKPARRRPPDLLAIPNFISGHDFVGREKELCWLDEWASSSGPLMIFEAIGGAGKSTLAWQWLNQQTDRAPEDFAGMLWYSFYEGGADMASFAASAVAYVRGESLKKFRERKTPELARLLMDELREKRFLLVLDGLERVLVAYHRLDASQTRDDEVQSGKDDRACIKPADGDLLRLLVSAGPSKILITSRLLPTALLNKSGSLLPGARHHMLRGLHADDALKLVRDVGVHGDSGAIQRYLTQNFDNHPQIVGVVAGLVKDYARSPGNFDQWAKDPQAGGALHLSKLDLVQRQTHILAAALNKLDPGTRMVLSRIAALGSAVGFETVEALNPFAPPPPPQFKPSALALAIRPRVSWFEKLKNLFGMQAPPEEQSKKIALMMEKRDKQLELEKGKHLLALQKYEASEEVTQALPRLISALHDLEKRGLLQWDRQKNSYDLHPVVRGYAFDALEQPERVDICGRIADHFRTKPKDRYSETKTLADVQQSMGIFRALVQAGRFSEALGFYRGDFANALSYSIEAHHEILSLLGPLFPNGFRQLPLLSGSSQRSYLLNNAAVALIELGRFSEARAALTLKLPLNLIERDWQNVRICLTNFGEALRDENKLAQSFTAFTLALELAEAIGILAAVGRVQWYLMINYRITGQFGKAEAAYKAFQSLPRSNDRSLYRDGEVEEELCWLAFYRNELTPEQLDKTEAQARASNSRTILRSVISLRGELALNSGDLGVAIAAFESAVEMAQAVGLAVAAFEARLALARARGGDREFARDLCDRLDDTDEPPHLELAELAFELEDYDRARAHCLSAYETAWADGPPFARWREINLCRSLMKSLNAPLPALRPFDASMIEPLPFEEQIRQEIQKRGTPVSTPASN